MENSIYVNMRKLEEKISSGYDLAPSEKKILAKRVETYWEKHPDVVNRFPKWKKYLAWTAGYQRTDYNTQTKKFVVLPRKGDRKIVFNKLKGYIKILMAKINSDKSRSRVVPKTSDYEDIEASRVGDRIIDGLKYKLNWDDLDIEAKLWMILCNRVGIRPYWNIEDEGITGYRPVPKMDDNGEELMGEDSQPVMTDQVEPTTEAGEVGIDVLSPFHFRTDPLFTDRKKWRWAMWGEDTDAEALEVEYGLEPGSLSVPKREASNEIDNPFELTENPEGEWTGVASSTADEEVTGRTVKRLEFWTPKMYAYIASGQVLESGPNKKGVIPLFVADERTIPISNYEKGIIFNEGKLKDAIPIQREFNRQMSIFSKAIERASKLKILLPENSVLTKKAFSNSFGSFIPVNTLRGKPEQMKLDTMPPFAPQWIDLLDKEFGSAFNIGPASMGQLPERASHASGALLSLLLEQDDIVLDPTIKVMNRMWGEVWTYVLELVQENYDVGRLITFVGDDGKFAVEKFRGTDLRGNTTVRVESQSGLPRSRALRIEYIMTLFKAGLLQDPRDVLEMLEFGTAEKMFKDNLLHENRALRENERIESNPQITPGEVQGWAYEFDEHLVHMKIHLRDLLSSKGENYQQGQWQALDGHIREHMNIMIQNQMQQSQAQTGGAGMEQTETPSQEGSIPQESVEGAPTPGLPG